VHHDDLPVAVFILVIRTVLAAVLAASLALTAWLTSFSVHAGGAATCTGKFPNPITDICWSCILPISIGAARIANFGDQEDIDNPSEPSSAAAV
jgi:conjugal transfer pilus assembly protein TraU